MYRTDRSYHAGLNWFMDDKSLRKDQGICGYISIFVKNYNIYILNNKFMYSNCWAFSALGSVEGAIMKKYNKTVYLSVQQLTDCSSDINYGNNGCQGGNVWYILTIFLKNIYLILS